MDMIMDVTAFVFALMMEFVCLQRKAVLCNSVDRSVFCPVMSKPDAVPNFNASCDRFVYILCIAEPLWCVSLYGETRCKGYW